MRPLTYKRAADASDAIMVTGAASRSHGPTVTAPPTMAPLQFIAGGTNILDFMKLSCWRANGLVDINGLGGDLAVIDSQADGLHIGALVRMSDAAGHPIIRDEFPVLADALLLGASNQIRNMASFAGNVLQRTRCSYFRDVSYEACNKRSPGSGCAALAGNNRLHAVLGVTEDCISTYPGDLAQALVALDTQVHISGVEGDRTIAFEALHLDARSPERETVLVPGDLITAFFIPGGPHTRRSAYVKVRDRQSYEFGLATAAVALHLDSDNRVLDVRIGLGGVAYSPWRARGAEHWLTGRLLDDSTAEETGRIAFLDAVTRGQNDYKPALGARTVARALQQAARAHDASKETGR